MTATLFLCSVVFAVMGMNGEATSGKPDVPVDVAKAIGVLKESSDQDELVKTAISLVQTRDEKALDELFGLMKDEQFRKRLDSPDDYKFRRGSLRIGSILDAIATLNSEQAQQVLLNLAKDKQFASTPVLLDVLINAFGKVRKPKPEVLTFLDSLAVPGGRETNVVVRALANMRSPEASKVIEKKILSPDFRTSSKVGWFTEFILPVRDDPAILGLYEALLNADMKDDSLATTVIQSLFDYRPKEWYLPSEVGYPTPPKREKASTAALRQLLKLADLVLKKPLPEDTKRRVEQSKKEVKEILDSRKDEK